MGSSSSVVSTVSLLPRVKMVERFLKVTFVEKKLTAIVKVGRVVYSGRDGRRGRRGRKGIEGGGGGGGEGGWRRGKGRRGSRESQEGSN